LKRAVKKLLSGEEVNQTRPVVPSGAWILAFCGAVIGSLVQASSVAGRTGRR
jgi:hypothetical protein